MKKNYEETTPVFNDLLEDKNLSSEEKLTYILLMKYQRFEGNEKTFLSWLEEKGLRSETYSKYIKSLIGKEYINLDNTGNYLFYAVNKEGEKINYNNQNFKSFFSSNYYIVVKDRILFSNLNSAFQKLSLVLLERELKRSQDFKNYKIHFSTIGTILNVKEVSKKLKPLVDKNIISYEVAYTSRSFKSSYINELEINYDNLEMKHKITEEERIEKTMKKLEAEAALTDYGVKVPNFKKESVPSPMEELQKKLQEEKDKSVFPIDDYTAFSRIKNKTPELIELWKQYSNIKTIEEENIKEVSAEEMTKEMEKDINEEELQENIIPITNFIEYAEALGKYQYLHEGWRTNKKRKSMYN